MVPIRLIATSIFAGACAATFPASAAVPLDSHAVATGVGDILLGAGAASALMAGMVVALAVSWRSFREAAGGRRERDPFDWHDGDRDRD